MSGVHCYNFVKIVVYDKQYTHSLTYIHFKMFSSRLILGVHECLCVKSQKCHLMHVILFTLNYCKFANGDVSVRFNGKDDKIVLECLITRMSQLYSLISGYMSAVGTVDLTHVHLWSTK